VKLIPLWYIILNWHTCSRKPQQTSIVLSRVRLKHVAFTDKNIIILLWLTAAFISVWILYLYWFTPGRGFQNHSG